MPVIIVSFVLAWIIMKGFNRVAANTRGEVANWWARAETRAHQWRRHKALGHKIAGIAAGVALGLGRVAYRTARFGARSFAEGVREGYATRGQAAAVADRWSRATWVALRRRLARRFRRGRTTRINVDPEPQSTPRPAPETEPEPDPQPEPGTTPLIVIDGEVEDEPVRPAEGRANQQPDLVVDFIQPDLSDLDGFRPAEAAFRTNPNPQSGGLMTTPVPQSNVGVGEITGIESTRIQLTAVSRVLSAASEALEHMVAGLAEYEVDQKTLSDIAQLADQVQAASSAAGGAVTNLNTRHGGVEEAVKSAPVRAAQTRYYEE